MSGERSDTTVVRGERWDDRTRKLWLARESRTLRWSDVIAGWQQDQGLREAFIDALQHCPWQACFWETPPLCAETAAQPFECVVVDSPALARAAPQPEPFEARFAAADQDGIATFANLGGDARLVVPAPRGPARCYPHLLAFVRGAPAAQVHALWRTVGRELQQLLQDAPGPWWVSTSGLGVHWIHLRLDERPKYYVHAPYRTRTQRRRKPRSP